MHNRSLWWLLPLPGILVAAMVWLIVGQPLGGTVVDAETGRPLAGVALTVAGQAAVTGADGRFDLQGIRALPAVSAETQGYLPLELQSLPLTELRELACPGQGLTLRLEPVVLQGTVLDAVTKAAIPGATVRAGDQEVQADAQGHYVVKRLQPGDELGARAPYYADSSPVSYAGQVMQDIPLTLLPATVLVRDLCTGEPLPGATVTDDEESAQSDSEGSATLRRLPPQGTVSATREDYLPAEATTNPGEDQVLDLRPRALCGTVRSADGEPVAGALVLAEVPGQPPQWTYTDDAGIYRLPGVPGDATLVFRRGGYARTTRAAGPEPCSDVTLEPFAVKGIYLAFDMLTPAYQAQLQADLDLVDRSELNAVVIELKTETGYVAFQPQSPIAQEIGAGITDVVDVRALLEDLHRRGIYAIARMPVFEDDLLATSRPEWAIHRADGGVWRAAGGRAWVDPFCREVWDYDIGLAREAIGLGFDEVQFDYVRFPSDGAVGDCHYIQDSTAASRVEAITDFLACAREQLNPTGAFLSADLFGLTTFDPEEKGIGQLMERVGPYVDYVSPMLYPSTYLRGMLDLDDPLHSPYDVVKLSLLSAHKKTSTPIRPWLQHFDDYHGLGITYGTREIELQKEAASDGGSCGWLFWNILGEYDAAAFEPAE